MTNCPCGSTQTLDTCCGAFIEGKKIPSNPEELMRSRYTAYSQANVEYIDKTMKAPANEDFELEDARKWARKVKWLGLDILAASNDETQGSVEFVAHYSQDNKQYRLHEISEFRKEGEHWFYVDGVLPPDKFEKKVGRNESCTCGSGKKYKKCCGKN